MIIAQHTGHMIAERVRYRKHTGLEILSYPNWNYRISVDRGQPNAPFPTQIQCVRIAFAHFNEAIGKELSLGLIVAT